MAPAQIDPNDFAVVLSLSRALGTAANKTLGISLTDFRVLGYATIHDGACTGIDVKEAMELSRSAVSMSLSKLREKSFVRVQDEQNEETLDVHRRNHGLISTTLAGRMGFQSALSEMEKAIKEDSPFMIQREKATADQYMIMIADRLGVPIMMSGSIDTTAIYIEVNARTKQLIRRCVGKFGFSPNSFIVLCDIAQRLNGARPSELAQRLHMRKPDVTSACTALTKQGFVASNPDPNDGRSKRFVTTPAGTASLHQANESFWHEFTSRVRPVRTDELQFFRSVYARK